jgi:phage/plasmid-like protein (TIGR03299 family)
MSHNVKEMFYFGELPWHGLGTKLDSPATSEIAIKAAGLNYEVGLVPMFVKAGKDKYKTVPYGRAVERTDSHELLGMVGNDYQPLQNRNAFGFFDAVVGQKAAMYHTAGALGKGETVWILAKLPGDVHVTDKDNVERYLLLTNSHNGKKSVRIFFTPVRVVCQNTLNLSFSQAHNTMILRHVGNVMDKVEKARQILGIANQFYKEFSEHTVQLVDRQITPAELKEYFGFVVGGIKEAKSPILVNRRDKMLELFEVGKGNQLPKVRGSLWAAVNSVTEYVDHYMDIGTRDRLKTVWFGCGAKMKERAYTGALSLL